MLHNRQWHPAFWWLWSGIAATLLLRFPRDLWQVPTAIIIASILVFARSHRSSHSRRTFTFALVIALTAAIFRIFTAILIGVPMPGRTLFTLPEATLPEFLVGIRIGGPVTSQRLLSTLFEVLIFAALILAIATANSLSEPYRLIRILPRRFYGFGLALSIASSLAPRAAESIARINFAQRIRGQSLTGISRFRRSALPILEESLDRAIDLAASLESRGYGSFDSHQRYRPERWTLRESVGLAGPILVAIVAPLLAINPYLLAIVILYFLLLPVIVQ